MTPEEMHAAIAKLVHDAGPIYGVDEEVADEIMAIFQPELDRLRAGEDDTPREPGVQFTPGQWIHHWNNLTAEQRLSKVHALFEMLEVGQRCVTMGHDVLDAEYHDLCSYVSRLHSGEEIAVLHWQISKVKNMAREWVRRAEYNPEPSMADEAAGEFGRAVLAALDRSQFRGGDMSGDRS